MRRHDKSMNYRHFGIVAACFGVLAMVAVFLIVNSCSRSEKEGSNQVAKQDINKVMESHTRELMAIPGVVGVAIGETDDHKPCILVLVKEESDQVKKAVPQQLEGYPTRLMVTGEIKPM